MSDTINILHILRYLRSPGGIEETVRILCQRLNPDRFRVGICSLQDTSRHEVLTEFRDLGVEIFCLGRNAPFFDPFTVPRLRQVMRQFGAHIVHTHCNKPNYHGRLAAALSARTGLVTTHHDLDDIAFARTRSLCQRRSSRTPPGQSQEPASWVNTVMYPFLNVAFNRFNDKVIAVSDSVRKIYTADPNDSRYEVVHAPYDEAMFVPHYDGLRRPPVVIGTVGRLTWQKGHLVLLHAVKLLLREGRRAHLKIIGGGGLMPQFRAFVHEHGLAAHVELCGEQPHGPRLYDDIDIYVQPSVSEGCSITILEAMGQGIPVIAGDIDGPRELVLPGRTGLLVPAQDANALAHALVSLMEDPDRARKMGRAGSERALAKFSGQVFAEKMARVYEETVLRRSTLQKVRKPEI